MPRSKMFSLPGRLRGRSRSVARKGQRLKDDGEGRTTTRRAASVAAAEGGGSTAAARAAPQARAAASSSSVASPENRGTDKSPTAATATTLAASYHDATASTSSPVTPLTPASPTPIRGDNDEEGDDNRSREDADDDDDDGHFTSAFTRSPPSFDNFDSDVLGGVFPRPAAGDGSTDGYRYSLSGSGSGNDGSHEPRGVGPGGILWGDADGVSGGADDDASAMLYSQDLSGSVDPPAILDLDDDEEDEDHSLGDRREDADNRHPPNPRQNRGEQVREQERIGGNIRGEWYASFDKGANKNRRLVSPSPSPAKPSGDRKQLWESNNDDDDLAAWGEGAISESTNDGCFDDNVFGADFFSGFDAGGEGREPDRNDDGFDPANDFFGNSWKDVNDGGNDPSKKKPHFQLQQEGSDPWGESSSFATPSFNYSISNDGSSSSAAVKRGGNVPSLEEKKYDPPPTTTKNDSPAPSRRAAVVWDDPGRAAGGGSNAPAAAPHHPLKQRHPPEARSPQSSSQRPKPPSRSRQRSGEVVVTFDGGLPRPGLSAVDERRKAPPGDPGGVPHPPPVAAAAGRNPHRRLNSNGSQSSRRSGASRRGRPRRSGGSVGSNRSNSSAVDQILEHYRQKRRGNLAGGAGKVGGGGSGSVHSGGQFSNPGGSPGSNAPGAGSAGVKNVAGSGSGASGQAAGFPAGCGRHHRNPSNESVSRIIDNLGNTATAGGFAPANAIGGRSVSTGAGTHLNPNTSMGKHYPPTQTASGHAMAAVPDDGNGEDIAASDRFLLANIEATIGPRGVAPDMESLSGRSSARSHHHLSRSQSNGKTRPQRSPSRSRGRSSGNNNHRRIHTDTSVDSRASRASRASRNSFRTYQSTRSALSHMSKETQSVANDLFRLEAQLADQVARQQRQHREEEGGEGGGAILTTVNGSPSLENITYSTSAELGGSNDSTPLGAMPVPRSPEPFQIVAPPGKLGILLSNSKSSGGAGGGPTHVSAVRSESVLAGKVHVGDIFVSIDGENVTRMNSKEITNIMARKAEFERVLKFRPLVSSMPTRHFEI